METSAGSRSTHQSRRARRADSTDSWAVSVSAKGSASAYRSVSAADRALRPDAGAGSSSKGASSPPMAATPSVLSSIVRQACTRFMRRSSTQPAAGWVTASVPKNAAQGQEVGRAVRRSVSLTKK
jgi:hypothetical protein